MMANYQWISNYSRPVLGTTAGDTFSADAGVVVIIQIVFIFAVIILILISENHFLFCNRL